MKIRTFLLPALALAALAGCGKGSEPTASAAPTGSTVAAPGVEGRRVDVEATSEGYKPSVIEAKKGETLVLRFKRTTKSDCLAEIVFPEQKIKKELPMNTVVEIPIKAEKEGKIPFQCGMAMVKGAINVGS